MSRANIVLDVIHEQLNHFAQLEPPCRTLELPQGIMLRYNFSESLYFYLRTSVVDGKIVTRVFATDSPYEPQKTRIGDVRTLMFAEQADKNHLEAIERLLRSWVSFVHDEPNPLSDFSSFPFKESPSQDS
jgi:hypothetical protein